MAIVDIHGRPFAQQTLREQQTARLSQLQQEWAEPPPAG